jgi:hypothetical protein
MAIRPVLGRRAMLTSVFLLVAGIAAATDPPALHLESRRLRSGAVFLGTVTGVQRLGALDGLTAETQGRMEATIKIDKVLRAPAGAAAPPEAVVKFDSRAPDPEGDGFFAVAAGERVLVFADGFEPSYPRELFHGAPADLAAAVKALRDFVATMDAPTTALHGLTPATRASQVRLYDEALGQLAKAGSSR